jgi:hypothetical protein
MLLILLGCNLEHVLMHCFFSLLKILFAGKHNVLRELLCEPVDLYL